MNDKEIFDLVRITNRSGIEKIEFEFQDAYCDYVSCTLKRSYCKHLPVQSSSSSSSNALKEAFKLLEEVKPWDNQLKMPDDSCQPYQHGYYRQMLDAEHEVEFKREGIGFVITRINRKDDNGFYYTKNPHSPSKEDKFVKDLPDGTQYWTWNNIGFLSGTAGDMIVKDGLVIKTKMTAIS